MSERIDPNEAEIAQASARLAEGLESCRGVIKNYQAMMVGMTDADGARSAVEPGEETGTET